MSTKKIGIQYDGVDISYDEYSNQWVFELRGRECKTDSLKAAKEAIDKPDPVKKKEFKRIPAYVRREIDYSGVRKFVPVDITSVAEQKAYCDTPQFWVVSSDGKRAVESSLRVYQDTPENVARMKAYEAADAHVGSLQKSLVKDMQKIQTVEVPDNI